MTGSASEIVPSMSEVRMPTETYPMTSSSSEKTGALARSVRPAGPCSTLVQSSPASTAEGSVPVGCPMASGTGWECRMPSLSATTMYSNPEASRMVSAMGASCAVGSSDSRPSRTGGIAATERAIVMARSSPSSWTTL